MNYIDPDNAPTTVDAVPAFAVGAVAARPMTAVELLRETWQNLLATGSRAAVLTFAAMTAATLPLGGVAAFSMLNAITGEDAIAGGPAGMEKAIETSSQSTSAAFAMAFVVSLLVTPLAIGLAVGGTTHLVHQRTRHSAVDLRAAVVATWKNLVPLFLASAVTCVAAAALSLVPCGLLLIAGLPFLLSAMPAAALGAPSPRSALQLSVDLGRAQYGKLLVATLAATLPAMLILGALALVAVFATLILGGAQMEWVLLGAIGAVALVSLAFYTALAVFAATTHVRRVELIHGRTIVDPNVFS